MSSGSRKRKSTSPPREALPPAKRTHHRDLVEKYVYIPLPAFLCLNVVFTGRPSNAANVTGRIPMTVLMWLLAPAKKFPAFIRTKIRKAEAGQSYCIA